MIAAFFKDKTLRFIVIWDDATCHFFSWILFTRMHLELT